MKYKTTQYDMFVIREDNRPLIVSHVKDLANSIKANNLLENKPIIVNEYMEVLDGQHRLAAAKELGVEIWYEVNRHLKDDDIILMNISRGWLLGDYMNYHCKHGNVEYLKLRKFMDENKISLAVALNIAMGGSDKSRKDFKNGNFKFDESISDLYLRHCEQTIRIIQKYQGKSSFTQTAKFWMAILRLADTQGFSLERWAKNLEMMTDRIRPRANIEDYYTLFLEIYNFRSHNKIGPSSTGA